jgi:hypothetical protein
MTDDDKFFERLRVDARPLRYEMDDVTLARIHARIREQIGEAGAQPTVAALLARWFRPLAATLAAVSLAAIIGVATLGLDDLTVKENVVEITAGGEVYSVGN